VVVPPDRELAEVRMVWDSGAAQLEQLVHDLESRDVWVRLSASDALEEIGTEAAAEILLAHIFDPDSIVRNTIADALGGLFYEPATPALIRLLQTDRNALVRICAGEALGDFRVYAESVVDALTDALLRDRASLVRAFAAEGLGLIGARDAVPSLAARLEQERNPRVRASILKG
jgi:HEAT repeat protein